MENGKQFTPAIRTLLLADQVPLRKIQSTIKAVIKCFFPTVTLESLRLPSIGCANYMRQHELKTVSMVHKAQQFLRHQVFLMEDSIMADMSREMDKLREVARLLKLPNAEKINWTLVSASTSDSASTQKRFNHLLTQKRDEDEERYGSACGDVVEIVDNLCAMHPRCKFVESIHGWVEIVYR